MDAGLPESRVSVLMPTFKQSTFIRRALESLLAQTYPHWELLILDDGSPDETCATVEPYLTDTRIKYLRLKRNQGLGAALNQLTAMARGQYLAYLPSDDIYYPEHLARLVEILNAEPQLYLAYGGVRWGDRFMPTLLGSEPVGHEAETLAQPPPENLKEHPMPNGNILKLVQVMHRRDLEDKTRWATREEIVSDSLEPDYWRSLLANGAQFKYAGEVSCEWMNHATQRHRIVVAYTGGLSYYRQYYGIGQGEWLNWQPSRGWPVVERERWGQFDTVRELPQPGGLKILLVGELGFNPERILALEERGHKLYGLWVPHPETWDATGPFPFGNIETIPYTRHWAEQVKAIQPDVIYALLNWQAIPLIHEVFEAGLDLPFVFHFKEGPNACMDNGIWPALIHLLTEADGRIFINEETYEWFQIVTDHGLDPAATMILDGDLPKIEWMTCDWQPKLSAQDGKIHTVCTGRPLGIEIDEVAAAGINVHLYGVSFHQGFPNWVRQGLAAGVVHLHPTVEPKDWVSELSHYDAAWHHVFTTDNCGDLRRISWNDLNLPARLGTYAAAGLPWILKDNRHSRVAIQSLALRDDVGIFYQDMADLADQLRDHNRLAQLTANMRKARPFYAFDTHADDLIAFFRQAIERHYAS